MAFVRSGVRPPLAPPKCPAHLVSGIFCNQGANSNIRRMAKEFENMRTVWYNQVKDLVINESIDCL